MNTPKNTTENPQAEPPHIPDYTEWRRDKFEDMTAEELNNAAAEYGKKLHEKDKK